MEDHPQPPELGASEAREHHRPRLESYARQTAASHISSLTTPYKTAPGGATSHSAHPAIAPPAAPSPLRDVSPTPAPGAPPPGPNSLARRLRARRPHRQSRRAASDLRR